MDRNSYADIILRILLNDCKVTNRCVILTTFDPLLAVIMNLKQNRFPVLFITNGITNKWTPYLDLRCKNTLISSAFARAEKLMVTEIDNKVIFDFD